MCSCGGLISAREIDDVIEAIECLKSWARYGLVYGPGSQIHTVERILSDLETRAAEME
jgi:hypothetical protein